MSNMTLDQLKKGMMARVAGFDGDRPGLIARLREIGFAESDEVELLQTGPFGLPPFCYRLNRTIVALRPAEARAIKVDVGS